MATVRHVAAGPELGMVHAWLSQAGRKSQHLQSQDWGLNHGQAWETVSLKSLTAGIPRRINSPVVSLWFHPGRVTEGRRWCGASPVPSCWARKEQ